MDKEKPKSSIETEFTEIDSKNEWPLHYQLIRSKCQNYNYTFLEAKKSENKNLNRYRDVSPYDHSRVILSKGSCDYINANLLTMEKAHRKYILTQGPLPNTTGHFWLMVWEQNCKAVLMLNKIIEKNQIKCHQYWPMGTQNGGEEEMILNDVHLKVQYVSESEASYYTTRVLSYSDSLVESDTHFSFCQHQELEAVPNLKKNPELERRVFKSFEKSASLFQLDLSFFSSPQVARPFHSLRHYCCKHVKPSGILTPYCDMMKRDGLET